MILPEPSTFTIALLAKRWEKWGKSDLDIEAYLRERSLHCFIQIGYVTLLDISERPSILGGRFELTGYSYIKWNDGSCDLLQHPEVFLKHLSGHPEEKRNDWEGCGSPGSLRQYWRLNALGHEVYRPAYSFVIRHEDIYIERDEIVSFEAESGMAVNTASELLKHTSHLSGTTRLRPVPPIGDKQLVEELQQEGWGAVEITMRLLERFPDISSFRVGTLLPARSGVTIDSKSVSKRGRRLLLAALERLSTNQAKPGSH